MTAGEFFRAVETFPNGSLHDLTEGRPFVVVAPHPDDESLGCAGLMMQAGEQHSPFRVVVATDGGASHPNSKTYPRARLAALRQAESIAAAAVCGVPQAWIRFVGLRDSEVPLRGAIFDAAVDAVASIIGEARAHAVFVTWRGDPHCDHEAVHDIARAAACRHGSRLWTYPVWGWSLPAEHELSLPRPRGVRVDVSRSRDRKAQAIACHRSQTTPLIDDDPDGFVLTAQMLARFHGSYEYFIEGHS